MKKKVFRERYNNIKEELIKVDVKKNTKRGKRNDKPNK